MALPHVSEHRVHAYLVVRHTHVSCSRFHACVCVSHVQAAIREAHTAGVLRHAVKVLPLCPHTVAQRWDIRPSVRCSAIVGEHESTHHGKCPPNAVVRQSSLTKGILCPS